MFLKVNLEFGYISLAIPANSKMHICHPLLTILTFFYFFLHFLKLPADNALKGHPIVFSRTKQEQLTKS